MIVGCRCMFVCTCGRYPITKEYKPQISRAVSHSTGGIKIKMLEKINYYKYRPNRMLDDAYKQGALEEFYKELFG